MTQTLTDHDARDLIRGVDPSGLEATLFVEAGAGSGKTSSLVDRVVALVGSGIALRNIAAITFTEKAAAELRTRVRLALEQAVLDHPDDPRWPTALEQVDAAAINTLHAFAQRLLTERPLEVGLPPNVEVLDEVASQIEFNERWERFRVQMLDDPGLQRSLLLAFAVGIRLEHVRDLARAFEANWDLVAEKVPWDAVEPPDIDIKAFLAAADGIDAERGDCDDPADTLLPKLDEITEYAGQLRTAPDDYELLRLLGQPQPTFRVGNNGRKCNWPDVAGLRARVRALAEERERVRGDVAQGCIRRLAVAVRDFVLDSAEERRANGRMEFHDLLVLARRLLRGDHGTEVRRALRQHYKRLLLDEFQDTDPIQIELAVLLASDDDAAGAKPWHEIEVEPGALFFVGDPKQSIYRFRRADIGLFLQARRAFGGDPVRLGTNFRTTAPVIEWTNHVFSRLIRYVDGSQPEYEPLAPAPARTEPPVGAAVTLLGREADGGRLTADELRDREAADVAETVRAAIAQGWSVLDRREGDIEHWRPASLGDITILIPARTSLPALERALAERGITYRAETSSLVYSTPEIRELFAILRAVADPTDQLALVTALRSRAFGCGDDDLATYKLRHGGRWDITLPQPEGMPSQHPVAAAMAYLADLHRQLAWSAPSQLLDRIVRDRRLFELGLADVRPRDLWRRLRFVVDQAREWSEVEGGTLREYLAWAALQASESTRVAETVLPETDDDSVRILTIHAAKGLEFPITIVSGLTTRASAPRRGVQVAWPPTGPAGFKFGGNVATEEFEAFEPIDEQMGFHERLRLLYVACTRAQDHLVVSLHRVARAQPAVEQKLTSAELLAQACEQAPHQQPLAVCDAAAPPPAGSPVAPAPLPEFDEWQRQHSAALDQGARSRTVSATGLAALAASRIDPGLDKDARDLDLPPWVKGRYGTAVGRAVHAVLQTIDLASGDGLTEAVAAQAVAEGVVGREDDIAALVRAALGSPTVRAATTRTRWRETYVAAPIGPVTLEGYIDLLYRDESGLVVVDYKTAASADDLDTRTEGYRLQAAAYALAVRESVGESVARCVFVFLTPEGAHERQVGDLAVAVEEVRELVVAGPAVPFDHVPDPGDHADG